MVAKQLILTSQKYKELDDELKSLKTDGRKTIADKLDTYREESEDDDSVAYSDLLQEKQALEDKIARVEEMIETAVVSDSCSTDGSAGVGCAVSIKKGKQKKVYHIVSSVESDPEKGKISEKSPLGKALLGKKKGQECIVTTPSGEEKWTIEKVG